MNLIIMILILILLVFVYIKINFKGFDIQNRIMKVICKTSVSKESHLLVMKIMDKYYLCSSTPKGFEILENLEESKVLEYINIKKSMLLKRE